MSSHTALSERVRAPVYFRVQFNLLTAVISLSCKGVTAGRCREERPVWVNSSLTGACGHSCRHFSKGRAGLTTHPSQSTNDPIKPIWDVYQAQHFSPMHHISWHYKHLTHVAFSLCHFSQYQTKPNQKRAHGASLHEPQDYCYCVFPDIKSKSLNRVVGDTNFHQ